MAESNEELLRHLLEGWRTRDAAGMADCFAPDGVYDNVPDCNPMVGPSAIKSWLDMCFEHLSHIEVEILNIVSNGEWVMCERLDDHVALDGKHMPLPVMNSTRIVDGKIAMFRDYYDRQTVKELGMG